MICQKEDHRTSDHQVYTSSLRNTAQYKAHAFKYASGSKQFKAKPFTPCIHCGFNDHLSDDCLMNPCCDMCGDSTHETAEHDKIIQARRTKVKSITQSSHSSTTTQCNLCGSSVHSTTEHGSLSQFKKANKTKPTRKWGTKRN